MAAWVIAGTGTDVGKTHVSCALLRGLRAQGRPLQVLKPVLTGVDLADPKSWAGSDPALLLEAAGQAVTPESLEATVPFCFRAPLSPDQAAAREGRTLSLWEVQRTVERRRRPEAFTLVEGAGGVMSPLGVDATQLDLWRGLGWPVLLVAGTYLGTLSHTLTALQVLGELARAVILSDSLQSPVPPEETAATLARFTSLPIVRCARDQTELDLRSVLDLDP